MKKYILSSTALCFALCASAIESPVSSTSTLLTNDSFTGNFTVDSNVVFTIGNETTTVTLTLQNTTGAADNNVVPLTNDGKIVVSKGSTLNITFNGNKSYNAAESSGNMDVYGTVVAKCTKNYDYNLQANANKILNVYGNFTSENGWMSAKDTGTVNLKSGSITKATGFAFTGGSGTGTLKVEKNATFSKDGNTIYQDNTNAADLKFGSNAKGKLDISGRETFGMRE